MECYSKKRKTRVLIVYSGYTTTAEIVNKMMLDYANNRAIDICIKEDVKIHKSDISWSDVVLLVRGASKYMANICKAAYAANRYVILYLDDDLLRLLDNEAEEKKYLCKVLHNINCFWTSNQHIKTIYANKVMTDTKMVNEVVLEPWNCLGKIPNQDNEVKFVFAGSPSHKETIEQVLVPALNEVHKKGFLFKMYFVGFDSNNFRDIGFEHKFIGWCTSMDEYRELIKKEKINIGLAPLIANDFTKCKFYNKFIEYTKMGLMGIYSDVEPYNIIVQNDYNGVLVDNTVEAWVDVLIKFIEDNTERSRIVANAQTIMEEKFNMESIYNKIDEAIPELRNYENNDAVKFHRIIDGRLYLWMIKMRIKEVMCGGKKMAK